MNRSGNWFRRIMSKISASLRHFMTGRYGGDKLNMLLLGESNARTLGLRVGMSRTIIFLATTLLAGTVTAYCGPIGFVGLAMPHLARMTFRTADHRTLMPAAMLWGAVAMLLCCLLCDLIARYSVMLPVNTITALLGVPIIIFVVLRNRNRQ